MTEGTQHFQFPLSSINSSAVPRNQVLCLASYSATTSSAQWGAQAFTMIALAQPDTRSLSSGGRAHLNIHRIHIIGACYSAVLVGVVYFT